MKQNNHGFSLVELLVSIVVLTVIMIPVLDNIVVSSRMNKSSIEKQDVSQLAGNLLEMVKTQPDVSTLAKDLLYEDGQSYEEIFAGVDASRTSVSQGTYEDGQFHPASESCVEEKNGTLTFTENQEGRYSFAVNSLQYGGTMYDALITYDSGTYAEDADSINNQEVPKISAVATDQNAVIAQGYSDTWAESSLKHSYNQWFNTYRKGENHVTNDNIAENMTREFAIDVSYDTAKGKYMVNGTIHYTVSASLIPNTSEYAAYRQFENKVFHSEFESLASVYLFYKPDLVHKADAITFHNMLPKEKAELTFYLVAQKDGQSDFEEAMKSYQPTLTLTESATRKSQGKKKYFTTIKNNVGLEDEKKNGLNPTLDQAAFPYVEALVEREKKTRLYEVTVSIFLHMQTASYKEQDCLVTMTSTKEARQ